MPRLHCGMALAVISNEWPSSTSGEAMAWPTPHSRCSFGSSGGLHVGRHFLKLGFGSSSTREQAVELPAQDAFPQPPAQSRKDGGGSQMPGQDNDAGVEEMGELEPEVGEGCDGQSRERQG